MLSSRQKVIFFITMILCLGYLSFGNNAKENSMQNDYKSHLTQEQYNVCWLKGTEQPFSGKYDDFYEDGVYKCASCGSHLFSSKTKFHSGSGWPSFFDEIEGSIKKQDDKSHGISRTEILCNHCDSHLGHIFDDGPALTHKRYCVNSLSLEFVPTKK